MALKNNRRFLSASLLVLFAIYFANITFFPHTHRLGDQLIVHSHFYGNNLGDGQPAHSHTVSQLALIDNLSVFLCLGIVLGAYVPKPASGPGFHFLVPAVVSPCRPSTATILGRAPPKGF